MKNASPTPWEDTWPTPEEWTDWFLSNDREGQLEIAGWAIRFAQESLDCIIKHRRDE